MQVFSITTQNELATKYKEGKHTQPSKKAIDEIANIIHNLFFDYCDKGYQFTFTDYEPYDSFETMKFCALPYGKIKISMLHNNSLIFDEETNLLFRAVHDMHHLDLNADFSFAGEKATFKHFAQFLDLHEAVQIVHSEILMQAAYRLEFGEFAPEQKVVYL